MIKKKPAHFNPTIRPTQKNAAAYQNQLEKRHRVKLKSRKAKTERSAMFFVGQTRGTTFIISARTFNPVSTKAGTD